MRAVILWVMCVGLLQLPAHGQAFVYHRDYARLVAESKKAGGPSYYPTLLKQFRQNADLTDAQVWTLMAGYTSQSDFAPYEDLSTERHLYRLNDEGKFQEALAEATPFVRSHPLSLQGLLEKSYAHHKLEQPDSATLYLNQCKCLMQAMAASANGRTAETAIFTIGPTDGQWFIKKHLGARLGSTMGSGRDKHGNFVDILSVEPAAGSKDSAYSLYFQIQPASGTLLRELKKK